MKQIVFLLFVAVLFSVSVAARPVRNGPFLATAFAQRGITRSGRPALCGLVAADLRVLPMGTRILVSNAGPYSGTYTVADTGSKVRGRHIDIFIPSRRRAREFGRRVVAVKVLRWGQG